MVGRKNSSNLGELLYKGHVRKLRTARKHKCPRTSPQKWNKTQHKTASCVTFNGAHTTHISIWHKQYTDSTVTTKIHPFLRSKNAHIQGPNVFISQKKFLHKIKLLLCFSVSSIKTVSVATAWLVLRMQMVKAGARHGGWLRIY